MPNWCDNHLLIKSENKGYLQMLYNNLRESDESVFLQTLRPVPAGKTTWVNWSGEGEITKTLDGEWDWDWCVTHWGTKWDIQNRNASFYDDTLEVSFDTAWSPPVEALQYAAKQHGFTFKLYYEESGMMFVGCADENKDDYHTYTYGCHPQEEIPVYLLTEFPHIEENYEDYLYEKVMDKEI